MLSRQVRVLVVNNPCPIPYQSYGEMWVDGFNDAGCLVTVWPYEQVSAIPPSFDLYFFADIRYRLEDIPWYLNPRVVYSFDGHGASTEHWEEASKYFDRVALASKPEVLALNGGQASGKGVWLSEAANLRIHNQVVAFDDRPHEIGYIGNPDSCASRGGVTKDDMRAYMKELSPSSFDLKMDLGAGATVFGMEYRDLINTFRLCLDWPISHNVGTRIFEASAAGCCVLRAEVEDPSGIGEIFQPWEHYIPYAPTRAGLAEALFLARDNNYALARRVAAKAQALVLSKHTYTHRCLHLIESLVSQVSRS